MLKYNYNLVRKEWLEVRIAISSHLTYKSINQYINVNLVNGLKNLTVREKRINHINLIIKRW